MRKLYSIEIERTVKQTITLHRSHFDSERAIEEAVEEARIVDSPLPWRDVELADIEVKHVEAVHLERDE